MAAPPPAGAPTTNDKSKRYDRQIRVWGAHGQQRLEACRIALLRCGPTGSETLKNLVLGGIAGFTIVDDAKVTPADLGNNFLVDAPSLGDLRAKRVTQLLTELNEAVAGSYVEESTEELIDKNPDFFAGFDLVIATQARGRRGKRVIDALQIWLISQGLAGKARTALGP